MKNVKKVTWMLVVALGTSLFVSGCTQQNAGASQSDAVLAPAASAADTNAIATTKVQINNDTPVENQAAALVGTNAPVQGTDNGKKPEPPIKPGANKPLPADIFISPALRDVIKLAEAGIEESVLLSYVSNSTRTFNLGADQIIYLNDIGMPDSVVLAMIERDRQMGVATAQVPATTSTKTQPQPDQVEPAPQPSQELYTSAQTEPDITVVNYNYFYNSLAPYGSWLWIEDYGWCWQPTVVLIDTGWQPYCYRGRWVYSNWGWYWHSDYSWGRIVFHYGRWFRHPRRGWCWWPDTVWAPAWVTWRYTDTYCGWAPLPPYTSYSVGVGLIYRGRPVSHDFCFSFGADYYTYVSWSNFADQRPYRHRLPHDRVRHIHEQTIVVNNFVHGDNNIVGNIGIPLDRASKFARRDIPRAVVRDLPADAPRRELASRPTREGDRLVVYREPLPGQEHGRRTIGRANSRLEQIQFAPGTETLRETGVQPGRPDISLRGDRPGRGPSSAEVQPGDQPIGPRKSARHSEQLGTENPETIVRRPVQTRSLETQTAHSTQIQPSGADQAASQASGIEPGSHTAKPHPSRVVTVGAERETGQRREPVVSRELARPTPRSSVGETGPADTPSANTDVPQPRVVTSPSVNRADTSRPATPQAGMGQSAQPPVGVRQDTPARVEPAKRAAPPRAQTVVQPGDTRQSAPVQRQSARPQQMPNTRQPVQQHINAQSAPPPSQAPAARSAPSRQHIAIPAPRPNPPPPVEQHISVPRAPQPNPPPQPNAHAPGGRPGGNTDRGAPPRNIRER